MAEVPKRQKIRGLDRIYFYYDLLSKIFSERIRDIIFFIQRFAVGGLAQVFEIATVFFNPMPKNTSPFFRIVFGIPRFLVGVFLLTFLSLVMLAVFLIGGTLSGIFGFRNLVDYSLKEQIAAWSTVGILLLFLPHFISDFTLYKVSLFFCYLLILVGFNFLYGQCGILSLGHAGFVAIGAFITAFFYNGSFGFKLPFFISMVLASSCSFVLGIAMGLPSLRVKDYYLVIVTLAFMLAIPQILTSQYLSEYSGVNLGGLSIDQMVIPHFFSWISPQSWAYFFVVGTVFFLVIFAYNLMHHSSIGRAFRTIKCDVEISTILGIPVVRYKLLAFAMSATYASTAGSLIMYLNKFISTDSYTVNDSIDYIVAAVVGGPESIFGCSIGGLFLTFEKDIAAAMGHMVFRGNFLTRMFYGVLMILIVFMASRGIGGEFTRRMKSRLLPKPQRGKYYYAPPPDYDFLNMKGSTIKEE